MLSEKQALRKKEKIITWLIAIIVAIALIVAFVIVIKKQTPIPVNTGQGNRMSLDIKYWLFREGYTTPVFTIKNPQDITRRDCSVTVNDKYIFDISEIPSNKVSQDIITINTNSFVREDGAVLDASSNPPRSVCVICKEPIYNSYCGNFTR